MVFARLIEVDDASCSGRLNERKTVAGFEERLQIPRPTAGKMLVVAPHVHHSVASLGYVVHIAFVDKLAIAVQFGMANTIVVVHAVHVVVSPCAESYLAPGTVSGVAKGINTTFLCILEDAFACLRIAFERISGG